MTTDKKPATYEEAIQILEELISDKDKRYIKSLSQSEARGALHFTLGHWIRNNWIYAKDSPLGETIRKGSMSHIDDYSAAIISMYHNHLSGKPMNVTEELENNVALLRYSKLFGRGE